MVAVNGFIPELNAIKLAILPVPLAARPITGVLFVQLYTVPGGAVTAPLKFTAVVGAPLHTTWLATGFTVGIGLTTTVAVTGVPGQPLAVGVIVKVTVMGVLVGLVKVPLIGLPEPLMGIPVTIGLSLTQLYVVPATPDPQLIPGKE